jgi:hypothetical protein
MKTKHCLSTVSRRAKTLVALTSTFTFLTVASSAYAASVSELLEQGIYSEETKGDIDGALKFYQQVVSEAKGSQTLAAQAQYRLGVCYYKKKNYTEATAAFEKLVKDYPDQKALVALARNYLDGANILQPAPWVDGEQLRLDIKLAAGLKIGTVSYTINAGEVNGTKTWRTSARMFAGAQSFSQVDVEANTFKPIHGRWMHTLLGDVETDYSGDRAEMKTKGKEGTKNIELEGTVFDNEEAVQLMRRLPLEVGYKTDFRFFSSLGGGTTIPLKAEVLAQEKVTVPAGTFDCYKVELSIRQTFWYSADSHRYLVKFEAGGVMAELVSVLQRKPGQPVSYEDPVQHFSMTAPENWLFDRHESPDGKPTLIILHPEAVSTGTLTVRNVNTLKEESQKSVRAWATHQSEAAAKTLKNWKVRPESWKDLKVAGQSAVSVVGDFVEGQEKKVAYGVFAFVNGNAVEFSFNAPAADLDALLPKFEAMVASYKPGSR